MHDMRRPGGGTTLQLGRYEVLKLLGKGGMGAVYRSRNVDTGEIVAVKLMTADAAADPVLLKRFEQEFKAVSRLGHPHIVRGLDFGIEGGRPYLVMELVDGDNLAQFVRKQGPLKLKDAIRIITEIADGLRLAHRVGLVHRDVKPENILLSSSGEAKLTDLGLSKDLQAQTSLTKSRSCLGTVAYMAPEQFDDAKRVDARCDVYGLAATLYYALAGVPPFRGRGNMAVLKKKLDNDFVQLSQARPGFGTALDEAMRRALHADLEQRPDSCDAFIAALREALESASVRRDDQPPPKPGEGAEKRVGLRYPSALEAVCRSLQGEQALAEIIDISLKGIRLETDRPLERASFVNVTVCDDKQNRVWSWRIEVRWARAIAPDRWLVGGKLTRALSAAELEVFADNKTPTTAIVQPDKNVTR